MIKIDKYTKTIRQLMTNYRNGEIISKEYKLKLKEYYDEVQSSFNDKPFGSFCSADGVWAYIVRNAEIKLPRGRKEIKMKAGDSKTKDEELKKGDRVRFRRVVDPDDDKIVMELLEDPDGGRVLVKSLIWDALNPTRVLPTSELIKDSETKDVMKK